jgi:hypothetical protein
MDGNGIYLSIEFPALYATVVQPAEFEVRSTVSAGVPPPAGTQPIEEFHEDLEDSPDAGFAHRDGL